MGSIENYGLASTHWSLGGLVLVALAASEYSGAGTIVALPISAVGISFAAFCGFSAEDKALNKRRSCGDIVNFLEIWLNILERLVSAATCARVASATVDYMSEGRLREWLFGLESHSLGEPWPDVLGITIIAVVTTLSMLGLEKSFHFCVLLYMALVVSFFFFLAVGGYHTDIIFWNWSEDFKKRSWKSVFTTAAMCAFGFSNTFPSALIFKRIKLLTFVITPLACYIFIALIFTLMSHYREVAGTAIPLVRVFEVRDVDWARPVMAACTICIVCLALTEIMPSLYNLLVKLAGRDWKVLVSPILYRNSLTGAPVLAIFTAGSLVSILAFACPLSYLVRTLNASCLYKCAIKSSTALYSRYKPEYNCTEVSAPTSTIQYSILKQSKKQPKKSKSFYDVLPSYLRKNKATVTTSDSKIARSKHGSNSGDKEYLLLDHYSTSSADHLHIDAGSESEIDDNSPNCSDAEDSASSTDIDAVVQEYKDRVQVATISNFTENRSPTVFTGRVVSVLILILYVSSSLLSIGILFNITQLAWSSIAIAVISLFIICAMPQNISTKEISVIRSPIIFTWISFVAIIINVLLATTLLIEIWPALVLWVLAGLILFSRCSCCSCFEENRLRSNSTKTECSIASNAILREQKYIEVDAIIIPR